ncbi:MAG: hypothetical protein NVS2B17_15960 [Candidatus Velthaea sp.]
MAVLSAASLRVRTIALTTLALIFGGVMPAAAHPAHAHRAITTASPAAQTQFDRGLTMLYAFNIGQARDEFRAAQRSDATCTMCYVGEALCDTIDINQVSTAEGESRGFDAVARGRKIASNAPQDERELLNAVALRFDPGVSLTQRYAAFYEALQRYAQTHPHDGFGYTQAAYAGWNASDNVIGSDGTLNAAGRTMASDLDAALTRDPDDIGAHHLRIHFWEIAKDAGRALPDADYLAALTYEPGESHLPHVLARRRLRSAGIEQRSRSRER